MYVILGVDPEWSESMRTLLVHGMPDRLVKIIGLSAPDGGGLCIQRFEFDLGGHRALRGCVPRSILAPSRFDDMVSEMAKETSNRPGDRAASRAVPNCFGSLGRHPGLIQM
jgi:hypothetical protein